MALGVARSLLEWDSVAGRDRRAVVSVGNFDGLHIGHQRILGAVVERARREKLLAAAITFDPHPLKVLRPQGAPALIMTLDQRLEGFGRLGLDAALVLRFDEALAALPAEEFVVRVIANAVRASCVLVGVNFRYGHRQTGDVAQLQELGKTHGFCVEVAAAAEVNGVPVSSTAIRRAVAEGKVEEAAPLLGRPFSLTGKIVQGEGRGRELLLPTLNLKAEQELLPLKGVYATETMSDGNKLPSVTNIGTRPTFDGNALSIETFVMDSHFSEPPEHIELRFYRRLRDEKKFPSPEALRVQIEADVQQARELFRSSRAPDPRVTPNR